MKIDAISDLHGSRPTLPGGDLLIIAGDMNARDKLSEWVSFYHWLEKQNYRKKIYIAGNHDGFLTQYNTSSDPMWEKLNADHTVEYLCDSLTEFEGLKIWGTPWSLSFDESNPHCRSFTGTEEELKAKYDLIPDDIDILISHGPMKHMLDANRDGYACGSYELRNAVDRVKPKLLICGHIHEQGGKQMMYKHTGKNTWCVNASYVDEHYKPVNRYMRMKI